MVGDRPEPLELAGGMAETYDRGVHSDSSDQEEGGPKEMEEGMGHRGAGESERSVKDLTWLMRRMSRLAGHEAGHSPKESLRYQGRGREGGWGPGVELMQASDIHSLSLFLL